MHSFLSFMLLSLLITSKQCPWQRLLTGIHEQKVRALISLAFLQIEDCSRPPVRLYICGIASCWVDLPYRP